MTQKNWPLLIQTAEYIVDHPSEWDQSWWVSECGTTACFAGWAVRLADFEFVGDSRGTVPRISLSRDRYFELKEAGVSAWQSANSYNVGVCDLSRHLLGLKIGNETVDLFACTNGLEDILIKLDEWAFADGMYLTDKLYNKLDELLDAAAAKDGF